jgi:exopolyphosphatase / guanosine-5'-triphosphate,3'-diphosphate pyrophosphatase
VKVGVVDVGGNTARLLVAAAARDGLVRIGEERAPLRLGAEIERDGSLSRAKLDETATTVARFLGAASRAGCHQTVVLVTSPGRQARNRDALADALESVAPGCVRLVSAEEEGSLAYLGAVATAPASTEHVAVCDVGGGSTELAIGADTGPPSWVRSLDIGSLRVARRYFAATQPTKLELREARKSVRDALERLVPPHRAASAVATGGTARAVRKIVGSSLGRDELATALTITTRTKPRKVSERYRLPAWRAESLVGGILILSEIRRMLDTPLAVSSGGLREGAALELLEQAAARAA